MRYHTPGLFGKQKYLFLAAFEFLSHEFQINRTIIRFHVLLAGVQLSSLPSHLNELGFQRLESDATTSYNLDITTRTVATVVTWIATDVTFGLFSIHSPTSVLVLSLFIWEIFGQLCFI